MKTSRLILFLTLIYHLVTPALHAATAPTLAFTTKSDAKSSNDLFTVTGTVKSTIAVANVFVSANDGPWSAASLSGTSWNGQVTLVPGTNLVSAYAVNTSSESSVTNNIKVVCVLPAKLTIQIVGEGSVSPYLNGVSLDVSETYTIKAKPAKGFGFYYWSGGIGLVSNPTLSFTMMSDLVIVANFKETNRPTITITYPKSKEDITNTTITVTGTASDLVAVTEVDAWYNGHTVITANGTTNWNFDMPVTKGSNSVTVTAWNAVNNDSEASESFQGDVPPTWAPENIQNTTMEFDPGTDAAFSMTFDDISRMSQTDTNVTGNTAYGSHNYTQLATNLAELYFSYDNPPPFQNIYGTAALIFTNFNAGIFSNETTSAMATFTIKTQQVFLSAQTLSDVLKLSTFTVTPFGSKGTTTYALKATNITITASGEPTKKGTVTADRASEVMAQIKITYTDAADAGLVSYAMFTFLSSSSGVYEIDTFDGNNSPVGTPEAGTFKDNL